MLIKNGIWTKNSMWNLLYKNIKTIKNTYKLIYDIKYIFFSKYKNYNK